MGKVVGGLFWAYPPNRCADTGGEIVGIAFAETYMRCSVIPLHPEIYP